MKRWFIALAAVTVLTLPTAALAFGTATGDSVRLAKDQTRTGTWYATGATLLIEGTVDGDLICAGSNVTISGTVRGDVLCAAQTITITGPVEGSLRLAGQTVHVSSQVGRNITALGQTVAIEDKAKVTGDVGLLAQSAQVSGQVARDVYGAMQNLTINGAVGPVSVRAQALALGENAKVNGNLLYTSERQLNPDNSKVSGRVRFTPETQGARHQAGLSDLLAGRLYWTLAALAVAVVLIALVPGWIRRVTHQQMTNLGSSLGWGSIAILLAPVLMIALAVSVVGVPLAFLTLIVWGVALALSSILAGIALGTWILQRLDWQRDSLWWAAGAGIVVLMAVQTLPILGPFVAILSAIWSIGGLVLAVRESRV
jgi:cytoskeletal protein CcmA (bactofilin family)